MRAGRPAGNMRQLLRLPVNSFVYPIAAVSALQRSPPLSSTGICISAIFHRYSFFLLQWPCDETDYFERGREKERETVLPVLNIGFPLHDAVKEYQPE